MFKTVLKFSLLTSVTVGLVYYFVIVALIMSVNGQFLIDTPQNVAAISGSTITLTCKSSNSSDSLQWTDPVDKLINLIYQVKDTRYAVVSNNELGRYDLIITTAAFEIVGIYKCQSFYFYQIAYAEVIVLGKSY